MARAFTHPLIRVTITALFVLAAVFAQPLPLKDYTVIKPGPGTSFIQSLAQDKEGYIWVVASEGVFRWDGGAFHPYPEVMEAGSGWFSAQVDSNGLVWIFSPDQVMRYTGTHFESVTIEGLGRIESPNSVIRNGEGGWYIGTRQKGVQIASPGKDGKWTTKPAPFTEPAVNRRVAFLAPSRTNPDAIWYYCEQAICRWDGKAVETFGEAQGVPPGLWLSLIEQRDGTVWARSWQTILRRPPGARRFLIAAEHALQTTSIPILLAFGDSNVGVTTTRGFSIYHADGSPPQVLSTSSGLTVNGSTTALRDRENSLWIAQAGAGLIRLIGGGSTRKFPGIDGNPFDRIEVVESDRQGGVWFGAGRKLVRARRNGQTWVIEPKIMPPGESEINGLAVDPSGLVWIGSITGTLMALQPGSNLVTVVPLKATRSNIHSLTLDSSRRLWLTRAGDVLRIDPPYDRVNTILNARATSVAECPGGEFWIGAGSVADANVPNLQIVKGAQTFSFGTRNGLLEGPIRTVTCAPDGFHVITYWHAQGWSRVKWNGSGLEIKHFKPIAARPDNAAFDSRGRLWLGSEKGLSVQANGRWTHLDQNNGLGWDNMVSNIVVEPNDVIWASTSLGLLRYQATEQIAEMPTVKAQISAMYSSAHRADHRNLVVFEPGEDVSIEFAGNSFRAEDRTVFRYRLPQISEKWQYTEEHMAKFPQLSHGSYRFEVQAMDRYQKWDTAEAPAVVRFDVEPHWYETWWFRVPLALLLAVAAITAVQFRTRVLRWRQRELRQAVRERTASLEQEKHRTEELLAAAEELKAELRELSARRDTILEDERKRISREIHDELGQLLTGLRLRLAFLQKKSGSEQDEHLADLVQQTDTTIQTVRRIASELRPPVLDHFGLSAAIEWQVGEFAKRAGIKANCSVLEDFKPDARLSITVFRILQEALTNIGRHSQARNVDVLLSIEDRELVLQVEDDGRGITFDQTQGKRSIGLLGMSERATAVGGRVDVRPQPEGGTIVEGRFPLEEAVLASVKAPKAALG